VKIRSNLAIFVASQALLGSWNAAIAQADCRYEDGVFPEEWTLPFPAFRVIGPLYAVGTADLGVFLLAGDEGHILINTGLADSAAPIRENIESLGFRLEDVRVLLNMQSHWDHAAALAEMKQLTGAEMWATEKDARVLESGGAADPHFGNCSASRYAPVAVDRIISDGQLLEMGTLRLKVHLHPGHTEGSSSYSMTVHENDRDYEVLIANIATINQGKRLVNEPTYPGVAEDFAETFMKQKALKVDVWVAAHGSHYSLSKKYKPGQAYSPDTFVDPDGYLRTVEQREQIYLQQIKDEQAQNFAVPVSLLHEYAADNTRFTLFDARTSEEYAVAHIAGAASLPYQTLDDNMSLLPADKDELIVVYCKTSARAGMLKDLLDDLGYTDVRILRPAQIHWSEHTAEFEYPVESSESDQGESN